MEIEIVSHARTFRIIGVHVGRWCEEDVQVTSEVVEGVNHIGDAVIRAMNYPGVTFAETHEYRKHEQPPTPLPFTVIIND